jgi:hypothetical protein
MGEPYIAVLMLYFLLITAVGVCFPFGSGKGPRTTWFEVPAGRVEQKGRV